jgi:peptidoglycan/xylan/chitin deacetylase (PgdA/CDA1 family)
LKALFLWNICAMNFHWLLPEQKGIPVLMYHRIWPGLRDRITQTPEQLEEQLAYLSAEGYRTLSLGEYLDIAKGNKPYTGKAVLLTFDDGYHNNLTYVYPLLQKLGMQATIFAIGETLEGRIEADDPLQRKMTGDELRALDPAVIQLAMHGYHHENFKTTPLQELKGAVQKTISAFEAQRIPLYPAIAYPYGGRPKDPSALKAMKEWMRTSGVQAAFRIGNRVSEIPCKDIYEIQRIDIRGTDSQEDFRIKLRKGKLNPF